MMPGNLFILFVVANLHKIAYLVSVWHIQPSPDRRRLFFLCPPNPTDKNLAVFIVLEA
jgi:hypothetical protein